MFQTRNWYTHCECPSLSCMLLLSLLLSGCREADFGFSPEKYREKSYERNFVETFGEVDPQHTWNTATQVTFELNIPTDGLYSVRIYTANPHFRENKAFLAGAFDAVPAGRHTLLCDLPLTMDLAYVSVTDAAGKCRMMPVDIVDGRGVALFEENETTDDSQNASIREEASTRSVTGEPGVTPMTYIVACEDMGGNYDWDFNDVVIGIEHVSGQKQARVKLLAAGGTLPVQLLYGGQSVSFINPAGNQTTELHEAFGVASTVPVNVGAKNGTEHEAVYSEYFPVDASFSILTNASDLRIRIDYLNGEQHGDIHVPNFEDRTQYPQAFVVADPAWQWPAENECITAVYQDFAAWVADFSEHANWTHTVWGSSSQAEVPLKPSMIYEWSDQTATAIKSEPQAVRLALNTVVQDANSIGYVYGSNQLQMSSTKYVDLCAADYLVATVAKDAKGPVFHFCNVGASPDIYQVTTNTSELNITSNEDGTKTYTIDLQQIRANHGGHSHLIAVTNQSGYTTNVLSLNVDKYECAVENTYITNIVTKESSDISWTPLEKSDYHRWLADGKTQSSASPFFNLTYETKNRVFVSNGYGNDDTEQYKLDYAKMSREIVMKVVVEQTEEAPGTPCFVFNYVSSEDNVTLSEGSRYVRVTNPGTNQLNYYIYLKAINRDAGHVFLHSVRNQGDGEIKIKEKIGLR